MVRAAIWAAFLVIVAILLGRELLHMLDLRREGGACEFDRARFRRRTLGLGVLVVLAAMTDAGSLIDPYLDAPRMLAYYGVCFVVLIWLLIIAARDYRALAESWSADRDRMAVEALLELEKEIRSDSDDEPIPPLDFDQTRER